MPRELRKLRKMAGLTQDELARLARIERTRISRAENGFAELRTRESTAVQRALLRVIRRRTARLGFLLDSRQTQSVGVTTS